MITFALKKKITSEATEFTEDIQIFIGGPLVQGIIYN